MIKVTLLFALLGCAWGWPLTQEELAQYVARQQTAAGGAAVRRQPYVLQAQPRQVYQQPQQEPQQQQGQTQYVYQPQHYAVPQQPAQQPQYVLKRPPQLRPIGPAKGGQQLEEPEDYDPNPQYQFAFDIKDDEFTNYQQRKEQREGDKISGSYSVVDADGFIRTVSYTADPVGGFKADVVREPTDIKVKIPVHPPPQQQFAQYAPQNLVARKQQTQQYLQGSAPVQSRPQYVLRPEHTQVFAGGAQVKQGLAYAAQPAAGPKGAAVRASALGYSQQQAASPVLYQAYQQ